MVEPLPALRRSSDEAEDPAPCKALGYGDGDQQVAIRKDVVHPLTPVKHSKPRSSKPSAHSCNTEQSFASTRATAAQAYPEDAACNFGATQALVTELLSQLHEARSKNRKLKRKLRQKRATIKQLTMQAKTSRPVLQRHRQSQDVTSARPPLPRKRHCQGGETCCLAPGISIYMLHILPLASICICLYLLFGDMLRNLSLHPSDAVPGNWLLPVAFEIIRDFQIQDLDFLLRSCGFHIQAYCNSRCGSLASLCLQIWSLDSFIAPFNFGFALCSPSLIRLLPVSGFLAGWYLVSLSSLR